MNSIIDLIHAAMDNDAVSQIGRQLGREPRQAEEAVKSALPVLIGAFSNSADRDSGQSLAGALETAHSGDILDNVTDFIRERDFSDGSGILGHVLRGKTRATARALGSSTGLETKHASSLMTMLAPLVMGALGKVKREQQIDAGALAEMLAGEKHDLNKKVPGLMGALSGVLDADGDGDTDMADLLSHGRRSLSGLF